MTPPPLPPPVRLLPAPAAVNHGGGLLGLGGDALLACWWSGASEAGRDVAILCSRSDDAGRDWSPAAPASTPGTRAAGAGAPAPSVGNVVLARDATGRVVMISGEVQSRRLLGLETCRSWRCGRVDFRVSADDGRSWSPPTRLDDRPGALPRSRPLHVDGVGDLLPVYRESGRPAVLVLDLAALAPGAPPAMRTLPIPTHGPLLQPSLAPLGDGRVLAAMRDRRRRWVHVSTWSPGRPAWSAAAATNLANPGSAVEAFSDRPGRIVLIYNPGRRDRRTLSLAFSLDGMRFARGCDLAAEGRWGQAAYPAVAEIGPGRWGVLFSVEGKREMAFAVLDRAFLDACAGDAGLPGISPG